MSETKPESKIRETLKVYQWAESYRSGTDGEIKAALKTFYNMSMARPPHCVVGVACNGRRKRKIRMVRGI